MGNQVYTRSSSRCHTHQGSEKFSSALAIYCTQAIPPTIPAITDMTNSAASKRWRSLRTLTIRHIKQKHHRPHQTGARADQGGGAVQHTDTAIQNKRRDHPAERPDLQPPAAAPGIYPRRKQRQHSKNRSNIFRKQRTAMANRIDSRHGLLALWENLSRRVNAPAVRSDMLSPPFRRAVFDSRRIQLPVCPVPAAAHNKPER